MEEKKLEKESLDGYQRLVVRMYILCSINYAQGVSQTKL